MKKNKKLTQIIPLAIFLIGVFAVLAAIFTLLFSFRADAAYKQTLLRIAGILFLLLSGLSFYYMYVSRETDPNFFLFDQTLRKNIPTDRLTFALVDERMMFYLTLISESDDELWRGDVLARAEETFGREAVYRPLVVYKMLYDLTVADDEEHWRLLEEADAPVMRLLVRALRQGNDGELAQALVDLYRQDDDGEENIRDFLKGNQKYLRGRMLRYVKQHIDYFY